MTPAQGSRAMATRVTFRADPGTKLSLFHGPNAERLEVKFPESGEVSYAADDPIASVLSQQFADAPEHDVTTQPKAKK